MKKSDIIATDILIHDLRSEDFHTRWFAAEVLGTKRDLTPKQIDALVELAKTSDVGEVLVWGLGMMKATNAEALIGTFLEHENNYYRWRAAEALRDLGTPEAIEILTNYLKNSKELETRWKCAWALGEIGDINSFEALWHAAEHDSDRYTRWKSIWGVTKLHGDVESIIKSKFKPDTLSVFMAWRLAWALGCIGDEKTIVWLESMKQQYIDLRYVTYQISLSIDTISERISND